MNITSLIKKIISILTKEYGNRPWKLQEDPLAVLIQTILSQNTSDKNSYQAFSSLVTVFSDWEAIASTPTHIIAQSIRKGGLSEVKARYLKEALNQIINQHGKLELNFLKKLSPHEARNWLLQLPGVGLKTANCVLLFSLGIPTLPVDTHIYRIAKRLGLITDDISPEKASQYLEDMIPAESIYAFHVLIIEHGRKICLARNPRCPKCVLNDICPSYEIFIMAKY